ncbi:MAG: hypothetical protein ACHP93_01360 [Solirubrobacterales bacterium]
MATAALKVGLFVSSPLVFKPPAVLDFGTFTPFWRKQASNFASAVARADLPLSLPLPRRPPAVSHFVRAA